MVTKEVEYIYFHNNTDLPINVEGWQGKIYGLSTLVSTKVEPKQIVRVHSTTGEWYMNSMFYNEVDEALWKGLEKHHIVGKFRSRPCASGNYSWMEYDEPFYCTYSEIEVTEENKIKGLITFSIKKY